LETFRQRFGKLQKSVFTCYRGTNANLVAAAASLYIRPGHVVCDPTHGKGTFWARVDVSQFDLVSSDLATGKPHDFGALPYPDNAFDHFVFDPPYAHGPGRMKFEPWYRNSTMRAKSHREILAV